MYDSNSQVLADAVREQGCIPILGGIIRDDVEQLRTAVQQRSRYLTSYCCPVEPVKGGVIFAIVFVAEFNDPGIVVHGWR